MTKRTICGVEFDHESDYYVKFMVNTDVMVTPETGNKWAIYLHEKDGSIRHCLTDLISKEHAVLQGQNRGYFDDNAQ